MSEKVVATEAYQLLQRDFRKYIPNVIGLYGFSLIDPEQARLARSTYFFFRRLDDVLDGDRDDFGELSSPVEYAARYKEQIQSRNFDEEDPMSVLLSDSLDMYEPRAQAGDDVLGSFTSVIDAMIIEHDLIEDRVVMSEDELRKYHRMLFEPIIDLTFIGLEAGIRSSDVPEFWETLARTYSLRDLEDDWKRGIINIPKHILDHAEVTADCEYGALTGNPTVHEWIQQELQESDRLLQVFRSRVEALSDSESLLVRLLCYSRIHRTQRIVDRLKK